MFACKSKIYIFQIQFKFVFIFKYPDFIISLGMKVTFVDSYVINSYKYYLSGYLFIYLFILVENLVYKSNSSCCRLYFLF